MASIHLGENGDCFIDSVETEGSPQIQSDNNSTDAVDKFEEEPEILPRIGDQYQAELPPLVSGSHYVPFENFQVGLPILLTWISSSKRDTLGPTSSDFKNVSKTDEASLRDIVESTNDGCSGYFLSPGSFDVHWSGIEKGTFILGLYIFEKNFVEVRRFVGTKDMGALLSFYYGKFYGSQEYKRWSACRKTKGKKGIYGQRIFSGARQQELLSRIFLRVSEECRNALLEVSKTFAEEKMSLADYVSSLKSMVGVNILVEAVAIGAGKRDLTGASLEPSRSSYPTAHIRSEIPTGKACSALTANEIARFLCGNYRLSKARSNDLFWEAVWPRLLARGWHSEQPKNHTSNFSLVFLLPGVRKFSKRKLVKGDDYFDSVADVLSMVAKDPGLIQLENEEQEKDEKDDVSMTKNEGNGDVSMTKNEENDDVSMIKNDDNDDVSITRQQQRHCYLQPRNPKRKSAVVMKFTVVDTSMSNGRVRELREISSVPIGGDDGNDEDALEKNKKDFQGKKKLPKSQVGRKTKKQRNEDYVVGPTTKRCRAQTPCSHEEVDENLSSQVGSANLDKPSCASSSKGSPVEEKTPQILIDLNLPQVCPDSEYNDSVKVDVEEEEGESLQNIPPAAEVAEVAAEEEPLQNIPAAEVAVNANQRRYSTRNQTPTMRSLQAVAHGYLAVNHRKRKGKEAASNDDVKPCQRPRGGCVGPNESTSSSAASQVEESSGNGASTSGNESQVPPPPENDEETREK
ncbi:hypothetical protein ABFS82_07G016100 [Erythranthe guttata]|uniref:uncharacterized protein LOC105978179 n=1 Tax=Erythranthe guttata TaxID=4155 RepID=UPI00064D9818|nr:PREDICTED: uncharacterized protein LOC105978179 [Erythranthe guttata]XP_012859066.1 PREDICTED: uncharacterized protein LOC105978179 [Erythranthe guttata]XP_012859075.1 PREDICTED: uncharacterized protein LOC105978179 [Erythranthe guttata]|eukprot:XP_012859056.1 PREDICTED: uncharacterized protein LOC105978179 [Erythranthe guttata]